jgi:hypothetical protein
MTPGPKSALPLWQWHYLPGAERPLRSVLGAIIASTVALVFGALVRF